jgi:hypothetical protein
MIVCDEPGQPIRRFALDPDGGKIVNIVTKIHYEMIDHGPFLNDNVPDAFWDWLPEQ